MQKPIYHEVFAHNRTVNVAVFRVMKSRINKLFRLLPILVIAGICYQSENFGAMEVVKMPYKILIWQKE